MIFTAVKTDKPITYTHYKGMSYIYKMTLFYF